MAGFPVSDAQRETVTKRWAEIMRQLGLPGGYPYNLEQLLEHLQAGIEGRFIESVFFETGELLIPMPALARPTLAELEKYGIVKIEADNSPTEVTTFQLGTVLKPGEDVIGGTEYEIRRRPLVGRLYGYQQAIWFVEHQDEFPEFMALLGKVYIDFPGLIVVDMHSNRCFAYIFSNGERWGLRWSEVDRSLGHIGRVASK